MIEQHYPSKRAKTVYQHSHNYSSHNASVFGDAAKARDRGITIEEYRDRVRICAQAISKNKWRVGDAGHPYTPAAAKEHGKCVVVSLVTHYDQYGTVEWNDPPFLMSVMHENGDTNSTIQCTVGWLVDENPLIVITNEC